MSSYDEKVAAIEKKKQELDEKETQINKERKELDDELERIAVERTVENCGLSEEDMLILKRYLTIVGHAITGDDVIIGCVKLLDEEPEPYKNTHLSTKFYSIQMSCSPASDSVVLGMAYTVEIKTTNEYVKSIVRSMISSTEYIPEECKNMRKDTWYAHWEDHSKFVLKNAISRGEYYEKVKDNW